MSDNPPSGDGERYAVSSGCLFRSINKSGSVWGNGVTEKVVWYVVRNFAKALGIEKIAPHDYGGPALGSVTLRVANLSKFSFSSAMSRYKPRSVTWAQSRKSETL